MSEAFAAQAARPEVRVVIKKYANRRLYNTASSSYVTLDHLSELVKQGVDFVVYDAKTGEDITRSVLAQIIFEQESRGETLLPVAFLRQLIGFYGESMQTMLPTYLQMSLQTFADQQEQMRRHMTDAASGKPVGTLLEDQARQNMALFERALKMFTPPFGYGRGAGAAAQAPEAGDDGLEAMRRQMAAMQAQLDKLSPDGGER